MTRTVDIGWKYGSPVQNDKTKVQCSFCKHTFSGGINRFKKHLASGYNRDATQCDKVPAHVRDEIIEFLGKKQELEKSRNLEQVNVEDKDSVDVTSARVTQLNSSVSSNQQRHTRGPIDAFFMPDPESISRQGQGKRKLSTNEDSKKVMEHFRNQACKMFVRWMYGVGIPFNAVNYDSFGPAIEAIGQHGPGMKPPTYHEVRVPLLNKEVEETNKIVEEHKKEWDDVCIASGVEEPLYRIRRLTRNLNTSKSSDRASSSTILRDEDDDDEEERDFEGPEIELNDLEAFDLLNVID